jgi:hypothetical protein
MQSYFPPSLQFFITDDLLSLSRFVAFFCQDDFDRLDRGVTFCHKHTDRFSFFSAAGRVLMDWVWESAPAAITVSDGI